MPPQTAAANLPKITALRQQLGYGDVGTNRYHTFIDDVRAFRRKFRTRQGLQGIDLYTWNSEEHQIGLSEMVAAYLEKDANGYRFWPDDSSAADDDRLQYSHDSARIQTLLKQLFFRLNEQEVRNQKYKNKAKLTPSTEGTNQRGRSTEEPIDVDAIDDSTFFAPKSFAEFLSPEPVDNDDKRPRPTSATRRGQSKRDRSHLEREDDYDVPLSPSHNGTKTAKAVQRTDKPKMGRQPKRSKPRSASSSQPVTEGSKVPSLPAETSTKRKSDRAKRSLQMDGYATGEDYLTVMADAEAPSTRLQVGGGGERQINRAPISITRDGGVLNIRGVQVASPHCEEPQPSGNSSPSIDGEQSTIRGFTSININTRPAPAVGFSPPPPISRDPIASTFPPKVDKTSSETDNAPVKGIQSSAPAPAPAKAPRIEFIYRRVTHVPKHSIRRWYPTRKLEETTLSQFMDDVAPGQDARALIFRVEVNGIDIVEEIERGSELEFDQLRKLIKRTIREELGKKRGPTGHHPLVCVIEIEPVMNAGRTSTSRADEVEDFSF